MRRVVFALGVLGGCGRIGFDGLATTGGDDASVDAGDTPRCGGVGLLADDFEDGVVAPEKWGASYTNPGTNISEANGLLAITLANQGPGLAFAGLATDRTYDLRGDAVVTEIRSFPKVMAVGAQTFFMVQHGDSARVELLLSGGRLAFRRVEVNPQVIATIDFVPAMHGFWRLREAEGLVHGEVSPDGSQWTELGAVAPPFDPAFTTVNLTAGTYQPEVAPGTASWTSVNNGVPANNVYCPADSFTDIFEGVELGIFWRPAAPGPATCGVSAGKLVAQPAPGVASGCEVTSGPLLDLRGRAISIHVEQVTVALAGLTTQFSIGPSQLDRVRFVKANTDLRFETQIGGAVAQQVIMTFNPTAHGWWRIRESGGVVIGETSADGMTWNLFGQLPAIPVSAAYVSLGAASNGAANPGEAKFDNFNR